MTRSQKIHALAFLTLAVCLVNSCFSQPHYEYGFIIKTNGDTLFGSIDLRTGAQAHKSCLFQSPDLGTVTYEPGDIAGYGFNKGRAYQSKKIKEENGTYKTVFFDVKVIGAVNLYKYRDIFYVQKEGDSLQMLSNTKTEKMVKGKVVSAASNRHIAVLNTLLFDCPELRSRTEVVPLSERPLTTLIEDYNACKTGTSITLNASKPWVKFMTGVTGGLNVSQLNVESFGAQYAYLVGTWDVSSAPFFGLSFDVSSPRLNERLSFHGGLWYVRPTYRLERSSSQVVLTIDQFKIPVGFRYTFKGRKIVPYLNSGISTTLNFNSTSTYDRMTSSQTIRETDVWKTRKSQLGFWAGLGFVAPVSKKMDLFWEFRYEGTGNLYRMEGLLNGINSKVNNLQVILGIRRK